MVHRESSHTCWKERNCGRRSSLQGVCTKGVDSRMEELLSHQTQEAGRFANRTGVLLAEIEVGSGKTDSRCLELLSVFPYMERRSAIRICVVLSILSGVLGGIPLTRWDFVRQNPYLAEDWHSQSGHREVIW